VEDEFGDEFSGAGYGLQLDAAHMPRFGADEKWSAGGVLQ